LLLGQALGIERTPMSALIAIRANHDRLEGEVDGVEKPKRRAGVPDVREIQKAGNDGDAIVHRQGPPDRRFAA